MTFWLTAGLMTVLAVAAVAWPLWSRRKAKGETAEYDLEVYRDQLAELERDRDRGVLSETEVEAARTEIARRMLAADARLKTVSGESAPADSNTRLARALAIACVAVIPIGATLLYLEVGQPGAPDMPLSARTDLSPDGNIDQSQAQLIAGLRARIAEDPEDGQAWQHLGMLLKAAEQYDESVEALRRAIELMQATPLLSGELGEALAMAAGGTVTTDSRAAFQAVLAERPGDPRARFYLALSDYQAGRTREAIDGWGALIADSPADAPWLGAVRGRIAQAAAELGLDVAAVTPEPKPAAGGSGRTPALTPEQQETMASMTPEERETMIREMTEGLAARLEEDPMDFEGWQRLIRSRVVLGERELAQESLDRALEVFAEAPFPRQGLIQLAGELGLTAAESGQADASGAPDIPTMVARLAERLKEDPDDLEGWLMLGRSYIVLEDPEKARDAMAKAAELAPDNPQVLSLYARSIRQVSGGQETGTTKTLMRRVLELDPDNPEALWFVANAEAEAGNAAKAREMLERLHAQLPEDNPDRDFVRQRIEQLTGG